MKNTASGREKLWEPDGLFVLFIERGTRVVGPLRRYYPLTWLPCISSLALLIL
jgi:hypothetical protein